MGLTQARETFCQEFAAIGNASEAYRRAYPKSQNWKPEAVNVAASKMMALPMVSVRVGELQATAAKRHEVTVDSVVAEYDILIEEARKAGQFSPAIAALTKKAELFGLFKVHQTQGQTQSQTNVYARLPDHVMEMIKRKC